jgi:hypothetical protein
MAVRLEQRKKEVYSCVMMDGKLNSRIMHSRRGRRRDGIRAAMQASTTKLCHNDIKQELEIAQLGQPIHKNAPIGKNGLLTIPTNTLNSTIF